jgi:hypothetical protein
VHLASPIVDNLYYPVSPHALNQTKHARSSVIRSQGIGRANSATRREIRPDLHTCTGQFSIPLALLSGRNGFQPHLALEYSTGEGNGPYGSAGD